jgi:alpha-maltose-1-phosphate synthase
LTAPHGVVVANPSSVPEIVQAVAALGEAGMLRRYHVPIAVVADASRRLERVGGAIGRAFAREARRRSLPLGVDPALVQRTAAASDVARVAASRAGLPAAAQVRLAEGHRRRFDALVARRLEAGDDTVVAVQGSALATIRRGRRLGVQAVLNATLPHPLLIARLAADEAQRRPEEANQLRGDRLPRSMISRRVSELAAADTIVVPSSFARDSYAAEGIDPSRLVTIPLGVDTELFTPAPSHREDTAFRVLFVGRVSQAKGVGHLVDAFLRAGIRDSELVLVGDLAASAPEWLRRPDIRHVAPVARSMLPEVFRAADVLVLPSLAESFGLVALEAMACAVPVIVSETTVGRDAITEGREGYVVAAGDDEAIAERLATLARDPDLRSRLGTAARARAEIFTWRRYRDRVIEVLR